VDSRPSVAAAVNRPSAVESLPSAEAV
jgi:hypothetical protein